MLKGEGAKRVFMLDDNGAAFRLTSIVIPVQVESNLHAVVRAEPAVLQHFGGARGYQRTEEAIGLHSACTSRSWMRPAMESDYTGYRTRGGGRVEAWGKGLPSEK